jgi:hypothetical protein
MFGLLDHNFFSSSLCKKSLGTTPYVQAIERCVNIQTFGLQGIHALGQGQEGEVNACPEGDGRHWKLYNLVSLQIATPAATSFSSKGQGND